MFGAVNTRNRGHCFVIKTKPRISGFVAVLERVRCIYQVDKLLPAICTQAKRSGQRCYSSNAWVNPWKQDQYPFFCFGLLPPCDVKVIATWVAVFEGYFILLFMVFFISFPSCSKHSLCCQQLSCITAVDFGFHIIQQFLSVLAMFEGRLWASNSLHGGGLRWWRILLMLCTGVSVHL